MADLNETLRLFDVFKTYSNAVLSITFWEIVRALPEEYVIFKSSSSSPVMYVYLLTKIAIVVTDAIVYLFFFGNAGQCQMQVVAMSLLIWFVQSGAMFIMYSRICALFMNQPQIRNSIAVLGIATSGAFFANGIAGYSAVDLPDGTCLSTESPSWNVIAYYLGLFYDMAVFFTSLFAIRQLMEQKSSALNQPMQGHPQNSKSVKTSSGGRTVLDVMLTDGYMHFAAVMTVSLVHTGFLTFAENPVLKVMNSAPDTSFRVLLTLALFRHLKMYKKNHLVVHTVDFDMNNIAARAIYGNRVVSVMENANTGRSNGLNSILSIP